MKIAFTVVVAGVLGCASIAKAGSCGPSVEYTQLKDEAHSSFSRKLMARHYCLNEQLAKNARDFGKRKDAEECDTENAKILQAIMSKNDNKSARWAMDGCPAANEPAG